jgi:hypothetical protein
MSEGDIHRRFEEMRMMTLAQQEAKLKTYNTLRQLQLPIPFDLKQEMEGWKHDIQE